MKNQTSLTAFVNAFVVFTFVIFTIFQFLKGNFESLVMIDFRMIFAGGIYCLLTIWLFSRWETIFLGIICGAAGGFLLYAYFNFFHMGHFGIENANPYLIAFAFIAGICIILGMKLYKRNDGLDRMGTGILFPVAVLLITTIICDYFFPRPLRMNGENIFVQFIFAFMVIALYFGSEAIFSNNSSSSKIVGTIIRTVGIGALIVYIVALNNIIYSGCYPSAPVGCECNLETKRKSHSEYKIEEPVDTTASEHYPNIQEPKVTELPSVSANVIIPIGGSLCGTLKMTVVEAREFAKRNGYKEFYTSSGIYVVIIQPGEIFHKIGGVWEPVERD